MRAMRRRLRPSSAPSSALAWNSSTKTAAAPACGSANDNTKKTRRRAVSCTANRAKPCVDTHWWLLFYETKPNAGVACVRDIRYARYSVSTSVRYLYRGGEGARLRSSRTAPESTGQAQFNAQETTAP